VSIPTLKASGLFIDREWEFALGDDGLRLLRNIGPLEVLHRSPDWAVLVADAVQRASVVGYSEDGERLPPNIRDVPKYAAVDQAEDGEPGMRDCYFARGRMRQKFYYEEDDNEVLSLLRRAMRAGVSPSEMHQAIDEPLLRQIDRCGNFRGSSFRPRFENETLHWSSMLFGTNAEIPAFAGNG
jgi:hypothetical protein